MLQEPDLFGITIAAAITSFLVSILIVVTRSWHGKHTLDSDVTSVQKFHERPVPRVGGIAILAGILVAVTLNGYWFTLLSDQTDLQGLSMLLLAAMPAFLAGLSEDLTKRVSVATRLLTTVASALLACWLLNAYLPRVDVWGLDSLLGVMPIAVVLTVFSVTGVTNAINIIDGFHGVAGSAVVIILAGMAFLSWQSDDVFVMHLALVGIGATLGFLWVNYPTGRLFLGDGGAYFIGFWSAETAVLMIARNPEINAWQVMAIYAYPVIEVVYSIYRKKVIRKMSPSVPDRLHLHMLIYRRVVCQLIPRTRERPWIRNAAVACVTGTWIGTTTLLAVLVGDTVVAALALVILEVILYMTVYTRLVRGHWCLDPAVVLGFRPETVARRMS